jgi:hypothetical protein
MRQKGDWANIGQCFGVGQNHENCTYCNSNFLNNMSQDFLLLGCDTAAVGNQFLMFLHNKLPSSSSVYSSPRPVVPKVCFAIPLRSATSIQGFHEYTSVMATLKFDILFKIIAELL